MSSINEEQPNLKQNTPEKPCAATHLGPFFVTAGQLLRGFLRALSRH